jgi:hypothetical protein
VHSLIFVRDLVMIAMHMSTTPGRHRRVRTQGQPLTITIRLGNDQVSLDYDTLQHWQRHIEELGQPQCTAPISIDKQHSIPRSTKEANIPNPDIPGSRDCIGRLAPRGQNQVERRLARAIRHRNRHLPQEIDRALGMLCTEQICKRQDQALFPISLGFLTSSRHTCTKEGKVAVGKRYATARKRSGRTGPIAPPALRNRCMISSPTNMAPDSENVG